MKKKILALVLMALVFSLVLTSCGLIGGDREVTKLTIIDGTFKYEYEVGEEVDLSGIKVQADYNDGSSKVLGYADLTISAIDTSTAGVKPITITYEGKTINIDVEVKSALAGGEDTPAVLTGIAIDASSVAVRVIKGETYSTADIKVIASYDDNTTKTLTAADLATVGTVDTASAGEKTLTVTYEGKEASITVNVVELASIKVIGTGSMGMTVMQGGALDISGISAFATYSDGVIESVDNEDLEFTLPSTAEAGTVAITVAYGGLTASIPVTVKAPATVIGIEVDYNSIKDYTVVADGVALDLDAIKANVVVNAIWGYVDGSTAQIERKEAITDKSALTITETHTATERYITVAYGTLTAKVSISETAPIVTGIELTAYTAGVKLGKTYDASAIAITVTYSNGATENLTYGAAGLTASAIDTSVEGKKTLTVSYAGKTATGEVTVYGITSVTTLGTLPAVVVGEELDISALKLSVLYDDGESETVSISAAAVGSIDTSSVGAASFTATYLGFEVVIPFTVKGIRSIAISSDFVAKKAYKIGETFEFGAAGAITVIYTDGTTATFDLAAATEAGFTFSSPDLSTAGEKEFTATYKGVVSAAIKINVSDVSYIVYGVSEPSSITAIETKKKYFLNQSYGYVVGDDNAFIYTLGISAFDANGNKVTINSYVSKSLVYLVEGATETLLTGAELDKYVTIDETKNAFDFTEEAIGKTFKIATRPASGLSPDEYDDFTRTHTFEVVDAYNVYTAKQLHVMTNTNDSDGDYTSNYADAQALLAQNGITAPEHINGVVIHNNLDIKPTDLIPAQLVDSGVKDTFGNPVYNLADYVSLYVRDLAKGDFTIYGNYFTIFTYSVPSIPDEGNNNSHAQLFRFQNSARSTTNYDYSDYDLNIKNLQIQDNDPNDPTNASSVRSRLGLIGIKLQLCEALIDNVVIERYYISSLAEYDCTTVTYNEAKLYNAWQNHLYVWGKNPADDTKAPGEGFKRLEVNIVKSEITTCGGPVIISQTVDADKDYGSLSGNVINIDADTKIWTYVTPDSTWFNVMGATPYVGPIIGMDVLMPGDSSYLVTNPLNGVYNGQFLNMIMVNLSAGEELSAILGGGVDVDGTLTIGGNTIANMDDTDMLTFVQQVVQAGAGSKPVSEIPILRSSNGGWGYSDGTAFYDLEQTLETYAPMILGQAIDLPAFDVAEDEYLTIYYLGMAIVLGDYHDCTADCTICKKNTVG